MRRLQGERSLGHEQLNRTPDELVAQIPEQRLRLRVDQRDEPVGVHADDGIGSSLEQTPKLCVGAIALGHVAHRSRNENLAIKVD